MAVSVKDRMKGGIRAARVRETKFLMSFEISKLNKRLLVLLSLFASLTFFDAVTTLIAISSGPTFVELNPIASGLFRMDFLGFIVALVLKYIPMIPLGYVTFLADPEDGAMPLRTVKVSAFVALAAADIFYLLVVGSNSFNLLSYYF
jgi:hypothetical protein